MDSHSLAKSLLGITLFLIFLQTTSSLSAQKSASILAPKLKQSPKMAAPSPSPVISIKAQEPPEPSPSPSYVGEPFEIKRSDKPKDQIKNIILSPTSPAIIIESPCDGPLKPISIGPCALIHGKVANKDSTIALFLEESTHILYSPKKSKTLDFDLAVPIFKLETSVTILEVSARGLKKIETFLIKVKPRPPPRVFKATLSPSIGLTSLNYVQPGQTNVANTKALLLTGKIDFRYALGTSAKWSVGANAFYTLATLKTDRMDGIRFKFLGLNWRVSYLLPYLKNPWGLELNAGTYFQSMIVTNDAFGFSGVAGPQILLRLRRTFGQNTTLFGYGKIALLSFGFLPQSLSDREIALGTGLSHRLSERHTLGLSVDMAWLRFLIASQILQTDTSSISISYGFMF